LPAFEAGICRMPQKKNTMIQKTYYKTKDYAKVKFQLAPDEAETVAIMGLNSDWNNGIIMKKKKDGSFTAEINLPVHQFKYLVDGSKWLTDEESDGLATNEFGGSNSVIAIN
jgi:hypothetical protein